MEAQVFYLRHPPDMPSKTMSEENRLKTIKIRMEETNLPARPAASHGRLRLRYLAHKNKIAGERHIIYVHKKSKIVT